MSSTGSKLLHTNSTTTMYHKTLYSKGKEETEDSHVLIATNTEAPKTKCLIYYNCVRSQYAYIWQLF
jgi:hypothetical protein